MPRLILLNKPYDVLCQFSGGYVVQTALCEPVVDTDTAHIRLALDCLNRRNCPRR